MTSVMPRAGGTHEATVRAGDRGSVFARHQPSTLVVIVLALALTVLGVFVAPTREAVGLLATLLMLELMFLKVPIALSLTVPSILAIYSLSGIQSTLTVIASQPYRATASWSLTVIPMFILMGALLSASGITSSVYLAARRWLGWMPGGLAVGTNLAGTGLATISGSTLGNTFALARVGIPEMVRAGYDRRLISMSILGSSLPGQLIPPSVFLIIVAGLLNVPVGPQLIAGVIPGLLASLITAISIVILALLLRKRAAFKDASQRVTWRQRFRSLGATWPLFVLFVAIFGGMFSGWMTATEVGAFGAAFALVLCIVMRRGDRPLRHLTRSTFEAVLSTGQIFFVLIGASFFTAMIALTGLGRAFSNWVIELQLSPVQFLIVIALAYLILGTFMEPLSMLMLTIPLLLPTLDSLGISGLWFGVFAVFMAEVAIITPPVGVLSFVVHKIAQDRKVSLTIPFSLKEVFLGAAWLMPGIVLFAGLLITFPELATWLPSITAP